MVTFKPSFMAVPVNAYLSPSYNPRYLSNLTDLKFVFLYLQNWIKLLYSFLNTPVPIPLVN